VIWAVKAVQARCSACSHTVAMFDTEVQLRGPGPRISGLLSANVRTSAHPRSPPETRAGHLPRNIRLPERETDGPPTVPQTGALTRLRHAPYLDESSYPRMRL
jgi:hypothetical protein